MRHGFAFGRLLLGIVVIDLLAAGAFAFLALRIPEMLPGILPGRFGPSMAPAFTGNWLFVADLVLFTGVALLVAAILVLLVAMSGGLVVPLGDLRSLIAAHRAVSVEAADAVGAVLRQEQQDECAALRRARWFLYVGAVLTILGFASTVQTYARADIGGPALLTDGGAAVANAAVTPAITAAFTADQIVEGVAFDAFELYGRRLTPAVTGDAVAWLRPAVVVFRALMGLTLLALFFGTWRIDRLSRSIAGAADAARMRMHEPAMRLSDAPDVLPMPASESASEHLPAGDAVPAEMMAQDASAPAEPAATEPESVEPMMDEGPSGEPTAVEPIVEAEPAATETEVGVAETGPAEPAADESLAGEPSAPESVVETEEGSTAVRDAEAAEEAPVAAPPVEPNGASETAEEESEANKSATAIEPVQGSEPETKDAAEDETEKADT